MELIFKGMVSFVSPEEQTQGKNDPTKTYRRRYLTVCESGVQYPQSATFAVRGDNIDRLALDTLAIGTMVTVYFSIRSREYQGKFYNDIDAWDIRKDQ